MRYKLDYDKNRMGCKLDNDKNRMRYKLSLSSKEVECIIQKGHDVEYEPKKVQYYHITDKTENKRREDKNEMNA